MTYAQKLKHPKWQKKRLEILERDKFACQNCNDTETTLHVHHIQYTTKEPHDEPNENLITFCEHCHGMFEYYKDFNVLTLKKYNCSLGKLFFIYCDDDKVYMEILYENGDIEELSVFYVQIIRSLISEIGG